MALEPSTFMAASPANMAATANPDDYAVNPTPYPARTKTATSAIKSIETTAMTVNFADKIFIMVTQKGRLAHWVC
jgi:proteasome assembly chaperone 3